MKNGFINTNRRVIAISIIMFESLCAFAAGNDMTFNPEDARKYQSLIEKLDVDDCVKSLPKNSPGEFWSAMIANNEALHKFYKDMKKNKGAEQEALEEMSFLALNRINTMDDDRIVRSMQPYCDSILIDMGIASLGVYCSLHVVDSEEVNAFAALSTNGFAMCLTSGLVNHPQVTREMLMGVVAHEFVHSSLRHQIRYYYEGAKKRRKNELIGGIVTGLLGVAGGLAAASAGYSAPMVFYDMGVITDNIVQNSTLRQSFHYSRTQEYEADLIAFRFMQNMGLEGEWINCLRAISTEYDDLYNVYSDHPTTDSRIDFLKFAQLNPNISNTLNHKLRLKRFADGGLTDVKDQESGEDS